MPHKDRDVVASIQALRAIAVVFVVLNHLFPRAVRGGYIGVDIFFVVSGFLISSHLLKELQGGDLNFSRFYLRRARRLLPASLLVLAFTALGAYLLMPSAWEATNLKDVAAAAVYGVNWWLAANAVNYFDDTGVASPVNHYWSLSVEEQFYLVWPALMYVSLRVAVAKTRSRADGRMPFVMGVLMAAILALSLIAAILAVHHNRTTAYFLTYARAWEFAAGGLAGLMLRTSTIRLRAGWIKPLFGVAWLTLLASGWILRPDSHVPGLAAVPVVFATVIVVLIGDDHASPLAQRIIGFAPVQWFGDVSYSLYLWHWPLLILAPFALGVAKLEMFQIIALLVISLALSVITKRHVEDRFRSPQTPQKHVARSPRNAPALAGYLLMSVGLASCALLGARGVESKSINIGEQLYRLSLNPGPCFGARATEAGVYCPDSHLLANRDFALQNWDTQIVRLPNGAYCQNAPGDPVLAPCGFGAAEDVAKKHVALLGDSHAGMWEAALAQFVVPSRIRVRSFVASSCAISADDHSLATYLAPEYRDACRTWRRAAEEAIIADSAIDAVIIADNAYKQKIISPTGDWIEDDGQGVVEILRHFRAAGKRVIIIDDVPNLPFKLPDCLARTRTNLDPCTVDQAQIPGSTPLGRAAALMPPGDIDYLTFKNVFCDGTICHTVIGSIPVYMDSDHISAPFARTLADRLKELITGNDSAGQHESIMLAPARAEPHKD